MSKITTIRTERYYLSVISLIAANIIPVIGVIFFHWSLFNILLLYWFETAIIGFYNIFKLVKVAKILSIFIVPFFIVHFGMFMLVHLGFIFALFGSEFNTSSFLPSFKVLGELIYSIVIPVIAFFISHGISFFYNFINRKEYQLVNPKKQMQAPYNRVIIMHITIIFGGWVVLLFKAPVLGLIILIILKIAVDTYAHIREHIQFSIKI